MSHAGGGMPNSGSALSLSSKSSSGSCHATTAFLVLRLLHLPLFNVHTQLCQGFFRHRPHFRVRIIPGDEVGKPALVTISVDFLLVSEADEFPVL